MEAWKARETHYEYDRYSDACREQSELTSGTPLDLNVGDH